MIRAPLFAKLRPACRQVIGAARGRGIPPIGDRVDEDLLHTRFPRRIGEGDEMPVMAVHSAIRDQPDEMQPPASRVSECLLQNAILLQFAVSDRFVDPGQVLINNPPRAEIEMADLRVSHLPFRQPHVLAARAQCRARIILIETVVKGRLREQSRVAVLLPVCFSAGVNPPSVTDHEDDRSCHRPHSADGRRVAQAISRCCGIDNPSRASSLSIK